MMRKRILAFVLAAALIGSLLVTAAVAEEDGAPAETAQSGESAPTENESGEAAAPTDGESTAGETQKPQQDAETEIPAPDPVGQLSFGNLESRLRENNLTVLMLEESIASIDEIDFDKMQEDLRKQLNDIAKLQYLSIVYPEAAGGMTFDSLQSSYDALKEQFDDLKEGKIQDDYAAVVRQLRNTEDQMIKTAETIYINVLELQNTDEQLQRSLAAMNRTVQEMELRYDLGQISALQLQQTQKQPGDGGDEPEQSHRPDGSDDRRGADRCAEAGGDPGRHRRADRRHGPGKGSGRRQGGQLCPLRRPEDAQRRQGDL